MRAPAGRFPSPAYGVSFLDDALDPDTTEALLCVARKNAKSAIVAVALLWKLIGPGREAGFRAGVVSVNRDKANELRGQMEAIAGASGLAGDLEFRKLGRPSVQSRDRRRRHPPREPCGRACVRLRLGDL